MSAELFGNYSFFKRLLRTFLIRVGLVNPEPDALGPQASPKTQIAVTCEVRTALSSFHFLFLPAAPPREKVERGPQTQLHTCFMKNMIFIIYDF